MKTVLYSQLLLSALFLAIGLRLGHYTEIIYYVYQQMTLPTVLEISAIEKKF